MRYFLLMAVLLGGIVAQASAPVDQLIPLPQQVGDTWRRLSGSWQFEYDADIPLLELGVNYLSERLIEAGSPQGGPVRIQVGLLSEPGIRKRLPDAQKLLLTLPGEGYVIRPTGDGVLVAGRTPRGAYYGLMTLAQLVDSAGLWVADILDYPVWNRRYFGDYDFGGAEGYLALSRRKINGFGLQWRDEWQKFQPEQLQKQCAAMAEAAESGLMDFMLLMHLYSSWGARELPQFCHSNPAHVEQLIAKLRTMARCGVGHIMICADDWTPVKDGKYILPTEEDNQAFPDAASAHAALMNRIVEELKPEFPALEFSLCPPPYSLSHGNSDQRMALRQYLTEVHRLTEPEVRLVWTGRHIVSASVARDDYNEFVGYLPGRRLFLWDNSDCIESEFPLWRTVFYPGFESDSDGLIFLNSHALGVADKASFIWENNDYLWNPRRYEPDRSFKAAVTQLYGTAAVEPLTQLRHDVIQLMHNTPADASVRQAALDRIKVELADVKTLGFSPSRLMRILEEKEQVWHAEVPEITIPVLEIADLPVEPDQLSDDFWARGTRLQLLPNHGGAEVSAEYRTEVTLLIANDCLYMRSTQEQPALDKIPEVAYVEAANTIWHYPEIIEVFLLPREDGDAYVHMGFDFAGRRAGEYKQGEKWLPDWKVAVEGREDGWSAVLRVPLSELERLHPEVPSPDAVWRMNIFRIPFQGPVQSLSPSNRFHATELFARVHFSSGQE